MNQAELIKWCSIKLSQILKSEIDGVDNISSVLVNLQTPKELSEYLKSFLGNTDEVNAFINEFKQKKLNNTVHEQPGPEVTVYKKTDQEINYIPPKNPKQKKGQSQNQVQGVPEVMTVPVEQPLNSVSNDSKKGKKAKNQLKELMLYNQIL